MAVSEKVTQLIQANSTTSDTLLYIVVNPTSVPTSNSITIQGLLQSNLTSNITANGYLIVSGQAVANAFVINYKLTPVNSNTVPAGFSNNTIWTDGAYIYVVTGAAQVKRVAIATW
jgi:hypothetical protein